MHASVRMPSQLRCRRCQPNPALPPTPHTQVDQGEAEQDGAAPGAKRPMSAGLVATPHPGSPLQLEGVLVLVAADVTTCTKATLSWARPKYVSAPDTGTGAGQDGAPSPDSLKANSPLTISELYWKDPGERQSSLGMRCCDQGVGAGAAAVPARRFRPVGAADGDRNPDGTSVLGGLIDCIVALPMPQVLFCAGNACHALQAMLLAQPPCRDV